MPLSKRRTPLVRRLFRLLALIIAATGGAQPAMAETLVERTDLNTAFEAAGIAGTFVLFDVAADRLLVSDSARAQQRFIPASTFKIANSLIALETAVVADENEVVPYGGKPQPRKAWAQDLPMREAIVVSSVPVYQELARRIGLARYRSWLERLDYGNRTPGDAVETFWLAGPLEISPIEQAKFQARLARKALPASERGQAIVRDILRFKEQDGTAIFAKTGWADAPTPDTGWWVGWIEREGAIFAFALNIDIHSKEDAAKLKTLGLTLLGRLGLTP